MSDEKKKPRKVSCLPCRNKKTSCDEQKPHCSRCIRNKREHLCVYIKHKTFGRPPKSSKVDQNGDLKTTKPKPTLQKEKSVLLYKEFVFEHSSIPQCIQYHQPETEKKSPAQSFAPHRYNYPMKDVIRVFSHYLNGGQSLREKMVNYDMSIPYFKFSSLPQLKTWLTANAVNMTITRACQLMDTKNFSDEGIIIKAFIRQESIPIFFYKSIASSDSPLHFIPTHQAIQLIDYFFQHHPYHILTNKTKLMQAFWNDSIEPLLLCVIYGISAFYIYNQSKQENLIWGNDVNRNVFLNYAYILLEQYITNKTPSSKPSLGVYQAMVLLSQFEALFGLSKHGMTIMSISYMLADDFGLLKTEANRFTIDGESRPMDSLDAVDREILISVYWCSLKCTSYGCFELGLPLRDILLFHGHEFPAASGSTSASYQYDLLNNNHSPSSIQFIEDFYTEIVVMYFSSKLLFCLPKDIHNVLIHNPAMRNDHRRALLTHSPTDDDPSQVLNRKIYECLLEFSEFVSQQSYLWSPKQKFIIGATCTLYHIHFSVVKDRHVNPMIYRFPKLDLSNIHMAAHVARLRPLVRLLTSQLQQYLVYMDESMWSNELEDPFLNLNENPSPVCIFMMTLLETIVELTMRHLPMSITPEIEDQIRAIDDLIQHPVFWILGQQSTTQSIYSKWDTFIKLNSTSAIYKNMTESPCSNYGLLCSLEASLGTVDSVVCNNLAVSADDFHFGPSLNEIDSRLEPFNENYVVSYLQSDLLNNSYNSEEPLPLQNFNESSNTFDEFY